VRLSKGLKSLHQSEGGRVLFNLESDVKLLLFFNSFAYSDKTILTCHSLSLKLPYLLNCA